MRRTTSVRALAATVTVSALLLSACGGDEPEVEDPTTSETEATDAETTDDGATATDEATDAEETTEEATDDQESATGAPADETSDTEEATAASGPITSDDGAFEVTVPEGWVDVREQVEQQVEIAARDDEMTDDFFTNIVVASEEPIGDLQDSIEAAAEQVTGTEGSYEMIDEPLQIDGVDAYGFVLTRTTGGIEVAQTQWWVEHDERVYVTTFSTAKTQQEAAEPIMEEILSTWAWQG